MIILNEEYDSRKHKGRRVSAPKLKGKIIHNFLVIEDIWDFARVAPEAHRCICKCLSCGKVHKEVSVKRLKMGLCHCECSSLTTKSTFRLQKGKMIKFLSSERNKAYHEMLFPEDYERVKQYDLIIRFLMSPGLKNYFLKDLDKAHRLQ